MARSTSFDIKPYNTQSGMAAQVVWRGLPANTAMGDRFANVFLAALYPLIEDIASKVVEDAQGLIPDETRQNYRDEPWGYETGTMQENLTYRLIREISEAVIFSIEVDEADNGLGSSTRQYWESIEFGWRHNITHQLIEGGHFIERAIAMNKGMLWRASQTAFGFASRDMGRMAKGLGFTPTVQGLFGTFQEAVGRMNLDTEQGDISIG